MCGTRRMKMERLVVVVMMSFVLWSDVGVAKKVSYEERFVDQGVYRIGNRAFVGVLTLSGGDNAEPTLTEWDNITSNPAQNWRLHSQTWSSGFELTSLSDDRFVLKYWNEKNMWTKIASWGWGDNKVWYLQDAGDGFTLVRNKQNDVCLKSQGISKAVGADVCNGMPEQQWKFA